MQRPLGATEAGRRLVTVDEYRAYRRDGFLIVRNLIPPDDARNSLSAVAEGYDQILASASAGDVVFFNGHVLHRSKANWTADRFRRAFVGHYCNARSFTRWGADPAAPADQINGSMAGSTNASPILARGDTHLPFARPRFGTPCAALLPESDRRAAGERAACVIAASGDGLMGCGIDDPTLHHDQEGGDPSRRATVGAMA